LENAQRCIEIDPLLPVINANLAWFYYLSRKYDAAEEQARLTIDIEPNHFTAHWVLGLTLAIQNRFAESIAALESAANLSANRPFVVAELARVNAVAGHHDQARNALSAFDEASAENYISPVNRAKVYLGLCEIDSMFESLEKGFAEHSVRMPYFMIDPQCDGVREDERFIRIRDGMHIGSS
jgi:tetratricopeptide (TPR) repeat protein